MSQTSLIEWSVDQVLDYIKQVPLETGETIAELFKKNQVNGNKLAHFTSIDLKSLGITSFQDRKKLILDIYDRK